MYNVLNHTEKRDYIELCCVNYYLQDFVIFGFVFFGNIADFEMDFKKFNPLYIVL